MPHSSLLFLPCVSIQQIREQHLVVGGAVRKILDKREHAADAFGRFLAAEVLAYFFETDAGAFAHLLRDFFVRERIHLDEVDAEIDCGLTQVNFFDRRDKMQRPLRPARAVRPLRCT